VGEIAAACASLKMTLDERSNIHGAAVSAFGVD
jgi:hypothetical protein